MSQAESLLAPFHFDTVIADKGYDSDPLRDLLAAQQVVERFINKIKWYRRIFTRYEKRARRYMAFLQFAAALIWPKRIVNGT